MFQDLARIEAEVVKSSMSELRAKRIEDADYDDLPAEDDEADEADGEPNKKRKSLASRHEYEDYGG